eukprot:SM000002S05620  [mRNA]  locus=s2:1278983:1281471:+ [translate_table: standard]
MLLRDVTAGHADGDERSSGSAGGGLALALPSQLSRLRPSRPGRRQCGWREERGLAQLRLPAARDCRGRRGRDRTRLLCRSDSKMYVPGFGDKSPEAKAADSLHNFFTFLAVKIVLAQLQSYNPEGYKDLMTFVDKIPLKDGDVFCSTLLKEHPRLAIGLLDHTVLNTNSENMHPSSKSVRAAYVKEDFEWDNLKKLSLKRTGEANTRIMREFLEVSGAFMEPSNGTIRAKITGEIMVRGQCLLHDTLIYKSQPLVLLANV